MLEELFPRSHRRFSSLPALGELANEFACWLLQHGYLQSSIRAQIRCLPYVDTCLLTRGFTNRQSLTREGLRICYPADSQDNRTLAGTVRALERFLDEQSPLPNLPDTPTPTELMAASYATHLKDARAFKPSSIQNHRFTAASFLQHLNFDADSSRLADVSAHDLETFIRVAARANGRGSLQHVIAHLRSFLRFLAMQGLVTSGLDSQIDTPRVYRLEQLPRALPWETVLTLLRSIDQSTSVGPRDYAMLFLCATYGLRSSETAELTLDDIDWRRGLLHLRQRKTGSIVLLPLTDEAGTVLSRYLREARPSSGRRELFLRARAPEGRLKSTAVNDAFRSWSRRSGLEIPFHGPHCLRHSLAVHLLRQGAALPAIGELLGHRCTESTSAYLRLTIEDLRDVALPVPKPECATSDREEQP
jgi:site-specific recombinase XerD